MSAYDLKPQEVTTLINAFNGDPEAKYFIDEFKQLGADLSIDPDVVNTYVDAGVISNTMALQDNLKAIKEFLFVKLVVAKLYKKLVNKDFNIACVGKNNTPLTAEVHFRRVDHKNSAKLGFLNFEYKILICNWAGEVVDTFDTLSMELNVWNNLTFTGKQLNSMITKLYHPNILYGMYLRRDFKSTHPDYYKQSQHAYLSDFTLDNYKKMMEDVIQEAITGENI